MATRASIRSGDQASTASPVLIPMFLGCCALGIVGGIGGLSYSFEPGDDVASVLGGGPLTDQVYCALRNTGGTVRAQPATPTWSPAPSITHTGTGPVITCALANGAAGCFDEHSLLITIDVGGAGGVAQASVAYDGATAIETIVIPAEPPPTLLATVDLTGVTLSSLASTTLVLTAPSALTVTFTTPTSVEDIATQFNAQAVAGAKVHRAEIQQSSTGAKKLRLFTTTGGTGVTMTIDPTTSTGEAILGFTSGASNLTATGTAATTTLPFTGLTFTFPATGPYVRGDTYRAICTGPRASLSAITAAATAARADFANSPFGFLVVAQPSDTASNCAALQLALNTLTAGWIAADDSVFVTAVIGSPFHAASANATTNDASIATADAALLAAFTGAAANFDSVAVDDVYFPGSTELRFGIYRRTAALAWAIKRATAGKIAADVGDGLVPEARLTGPDGQTRARNDAHQTTKLGRGDGPGFSALRSTATGGVKFRPGATRAGPTSRLRYAGAYGICLEIARVVREAIEPWEGQTPPTNPATGQMDDGEKERRKNDLTSLLEPILRPAQGEPNVSKFTVKIQDPTAGKFIDNGEAVVVVTEVPLGEIEDVTIKITAVGTAIA